MSYVDTSVIVAALDPTDHRRDIAREFLEGDTDKVVSELTLVELASVLSRSPHRGRLLEKLRVREELLIPTLLLYIMKRFKLRLALLKGSVMLPPLGELNLPIAEAMELSMEAQLRTLDLLHLAYAKLLRDSGEGVEVIVTFDENFKIKPSLEGKLDIRVRLLGD